MCAFIAAKRLGLGNEVPSVLGIIVCPTMHFGYLSRPVAMTRTDRRSPLQGSSTPGILRDHFPALEYGIEEIEHEEQLHGEHYHRYSRNKPVQALKLVEGQPATVVQVTTGHTRQTLIVHGPENK